MNGTFLKKWGTKGKLDNQFDCPVGIYVDPVSKYILVSERYNHRIQVFDPNLKSLFKFGSEGSGEGQFNQPWGIAIHPKTQDLIVSDYENRIQIFKLG